jgi:putative endonuclease
MASIPDKFWVYILHCENDTYYTGYTNDLGARFLSHVNGTGRCKYTKSFRPLEIAQCWEINGDRALAMMIERTIKKLTRKEKERIIARPETFSQDHSIQIADRNFIDEIHAKMNPGGS